MIASLGLLLLSATPAAWDGVFPSAAQAGFIFKLDDGLAGRRFAFDVSPDGQPFLASDQVIFPINDRPSRKLPPFRLSGVARIDELGFTRDGALLLISGKTLGAATAKGFRLLAMLPREKMHLATGSGQETWIWGGESVFSLSRGGKIEHLMRTPTPIEALAGDGPRLVFATQGALLELLGTGEPRLLAVLPGPARSLALAPGGALFYSTASEVGYLTASGRRYPFVKGKGAQVRVAGGELFLFFEDEGVVRVSPVESFAAMAQAIDAMRDGGP
ncbi:MAG: hypothetical protein Q8L48_16335 [Archangium sp.]|nr:hypothetical protein [Archangium sp.]